MLQPSQTGICAYSRGHLDGTAASPHPVCSCAVPGLPSASLPPSPIPLPSVLCPAAAHPVTLSPKQAPEGRIPSLLLPCTALAAGCSQTHRGIPSAQGSVGRPQVPPCAPPWAGRAGATLRPQVCIGCNKAEWEPPELRWFFQQGRGRAGSVQQLHPAHVGEGAGVHVVDVEDPIQVVHLVLDDPGGPARRLPAHRLPELVHACSRGRDELKGKKGDPCESGGPVCGQICARIGTHERGVASVREQGPFREFSGGCLGETVTSVREGNPEREGQARGPAQGRAGRSVPETCTAQCRGT